MSEPRIITRAEREARKRGLGTKLQTGIHAVVDASSLPDGVKKAIKGCAGCGRRAKAIDRAEAKAKKFFGLT
jgi:hypothetical protein